MKLLEGHLDKRWAGAIIPADHWHFHRRLMERYDATLRPREFAKMLRRLRKGTAPLLHRMPDGREIRLVHFAEALAVPIVVSKERVVTVLPRGRRMRWIGSTATREGSCGHQRNGRQRGVARCLEEAVGTTPDTQNERSKP